MVLRSSAAESSKEVDFWNPTTGSHPAGVATIAESKDFWSPKIISFNEEEPLNVTNNKSAGSFDFWLPFQVSAEVAKSAEDWGEHSSLPQYDPCLQENPYLFSIVPKSQLSIAVRRGRWLAQVLDLPEPKRRLTYSVFFANVFEEFPSHQTFRALMDIALAGTDPEVLKCACEFRIDFLDTPNWASRRSPRQKTPNVYHLPETLLSWRRAVRVAETCGGDNPGAIIEEYWFTEWIEVEFGNELYWSFLDYVEWRLKAKHIGYETITRPKRNSEVKVRSVEAFSKTATLFRGESDIIGVLYQSPRSLNSAVEKNGRSINSSLGLLGKT